MGQVVRIFLLLDHIMRRKNIVERLVTWQLHGFNAIPRFILTLLGVEIPKSVQFADKSGGGVKFAHRATGTVIHPNTAIGRNVVIFPNVTIGKSRPWDNTQSAGSAVISDDVVLCVGSKVIFGENQLIVGKGTIIGANAVLTHSTGENEIWAGVPAKKIGNR